MIERLRKALRTTPEGSKGGGPAEGAQAARPKAGGGRIENSVEYRLGCQVLDTLTSGLNLSGEQAAALFGGESAPGGAQADAGALSRRVAEVLSREKAAGSLAMEPEEYLDDPAFVELLTQMPVELALRVYEAERGAKAAGEREANARAEGEQNALERLRVRQELPRSMRSGSPAAAQPDFSAMSGEEFAAFKKRRLGY